MGLPVGKACLHGSRFSQLFHGVALCDINSMRCVNSGSLCDINSVRCVYSGSLCDIDSVRCVNSGSLCDINSVRLTVVRCLVHLTTGRIMMRKRFPWKPKTRKD